MARLVMKFGGTSVADIPRIRNVARHVKREVEAGHQVAVVVSAMAGFTNQLVAWTREAAPMHDAREYDTVVAAGEQITTGLLAIAPWAESVRMAICQPSHERALTPISCSAIASSPVVICSPAATTVSYSRASCIGAASRVHATS